MHKCAIKYPVNTNELIEQGNQLRADQQPEKALQCYATAFVHDPESSAAFNNYGNVMRELGYPKRAIPFLQHAAILDPASITARFNLSVCYLLSGDYKQGWPAYESRWEYEHLAGTEPQHSQPRWHGEDIQGKTILVVGEQGHGDNIQFVRFVHNLQQLGATVKLQVTQGLVPLLNRNNFAAWVGTYADDPGLFDTWVPIMSIPGILGITLDTLPNVQNYLNADSVAVRSWQEKLGPKKRMRIGFNWSGRRDSWLNQHKSVPFEHMLAMIKDNPQYEWINLQVDAEAHEEQALAEAGVSRYPGSVQSFADTAALIMNLDVVVSVDTAITHLAGALGRPVWLMLNAYATDWRWLLGQDSSPWYISARLFRQPQRGDWTSVTKKIGQYLSWYKV